MTENAAISEGCRRDDRLQVETWCGDWGGGLLELSFSDLPIPSTSEAMVMVGQEVESSKAQLRLKCTEKGIVLS